MSSAPAHGPDTHDDHAFTGEPVQVLSPDEPRTPGWIPLLGVAVFTTAAIAFLSSGSAAEAPKEGASPASPNAMADTPRPPPPTGAAQMRPQPRPLPPVGAAPGAAPAGTQPQPRALTPEQRQQLMQQLGKNTAPAGH
jgi:hypothetical protein